ncbi:SLBB domain-containing protein [Aquincola sp. J276]|nr:SLBB domain-containing protein [Aquincola sp. J276]
MPQVPADYLITPGDEIALTIWGSVDADLRLVVDRAGRLNIPRVGSVLVSGVRYGDLPSLLNQRVAQVFRNFQLSVSLGQLRSIRIYVTGFTAKPGSYTVSSLSTVVNGLMRAGGPSAAGTFRNIELRRAGKLVSRLDLYDLLIKGDRSGDRVLQPEDVIHIGAVGTQTAVIGSVNKPAIFELKKGETVDDVLRMAGGLTAVADRGRLSVERLDERIGARVSQLRLPEDLNQTPSSGDVLRAFSAVEATLPQDKQNKRVRIEGEVARPGDYILPPNSSIGDAIRVAGGLTPNAYVFGTEFSRESVRMTQQENYERALRDLETEFAKRTSTQRALTADEAAIQASQGSGATRLIERLRAVRPTGRIVLQLDPVAAQLPDLVIESGDRIYIPSIPTSVGVFGSVFNGGSYLYSNDRKVTDYVRLAGGTTRGADDGSAFVLRANGSVVSARQSSGFFSGGNLDVPALPGDTVFVPEELNKTTFLQSAKEWTQILYQFGLGAAALQTLKN